MSSEIVYLFGKPPDSTKGRHLIPGEYCDHSSNGQQTEHPCPRKIAHMRWTIDKWTNSADTILDPFAGSGTTGRAAKDLGRKCTMVEIEEKYCEIAARRMAQEVLPLEY